MKLTKRQRKDEVAEWVHELNAKGKELDDLCSSVHPTAWHEDPNIVKAQKEWKDLAEDGPVEVVEQLYFKEVT